MAEMMWWVIAAFIGCTVKGICGFANTLVFSAIMGFTQDNVLITPVDLVLNYPSNAIIVWKERKSIRWNRCLPLAALMVLGNIPGIWLLKSMNAQTGKVIFGFVIMAIGTEMMLRKPNATRKQENKAFMTFLGLLSGLICGIYGIGALAAVFMSRITDDPHEFKGNVCVVFLANGTFRLIAYSFLGIVTLQSVKISLMLIPVMLVGLGLGMKISSRMNDRLVKRIVNIMLMISGLVLVLNNL